MRTVIVNNIVSLDGCFDGPGRTMLTLNMDESFDEQNLERMLAADLVLLGPRSFELFGGYWPSIADAPTNRDDRALDETNRAISRRWAAVPKVVVADGFAVDPAHPWAATTEVVPWDALPGRVAVERAAGDGDILILASRSTWNRMLDAGLVDELHLTISPTIVGEGIRVFDHAREAPISFRLLRVDRRGDSDNVVLRYACRPEPREG